jgi:hypothetical protein
MKKKRERERESDEEEMRGTLAYRHVLHLSIFVSRENKGSTIGRESERERKTAQHCSRRRERIITSFGLPLSRRGEAAIVIVVATNTNKK